MSEDLTLAGMPLPSSFVAWMKLRPPASAGVGNVYRVKLVEEPREGKRPKLRKVHELVRLEHYRVVRDGDGRLITRRERRAAERIAKRGPK